MKATPPGGLEIENRFESARDLNHNGGRQFPDLFANDTALINRSYLVHENPAVLSCSANARGNRRIQ